MEWFTWFVLKILNCIVVCCCTVFCMVLNVGERNACHHRIKFGAFPVFEQWSKAVVNKYAKIAKTYSSGEIETASH